MKAALLFCPGLMDSLSHSPIFDERTIKMSDEPETRVDYRHIRPIQTRWGDNDMYGHVNNVVYYSYFDTAVNMFLIEEGGFAPHAAEVIGICPETRCRFIESVAYPDALEAGLRIIKLGTSSACYEIGIFKVGKEHAVAAGYFVHVYVERASNRPVPIPAPIRAALESIQVPGQVPATDNAAA